MIDLNELVIMGSVGVDVVIGPIEFCPKWGHEAIVDSSSIRLTGAAGNAAAVFSSLGGRAVLMSVVGNDRFGKLFKEIYSSMDVDVEWLKVLEGRTSVSVGVKNDEGERFFLTDLGVIEKADFPGLFGSYDFFGKNVLICGVNLIPSMKQEKFKGMVKEISQGSFVALDSGCPEDGEWESFREVLRNLLGYVDLFLPNEEEFLKFTQAGTLEEAIKVYLSKHETPAVVKLGSRGSYMVTRHSLKYIPTKAVGDVKDTVGAGDAFNAALLRNFLSRENTSLEEAAAFASKVAAEWIRGRFWPPVTLV